MSNQQKNPILCIPRVFSNITEKKIHSVFNQINIGSVNKIDIVPIASNTYSVNNSNKFNRVFIHFNSWNTTDTAISAMNKLNNGGNIKIIYDEPWFWKITLYHKYVHAVSVNNSNGNTYKQLKIDLNKITT